MENEGNITTTYDRLNELNVRYDDAWNQNRLELELILRTERNKLIGSRPYIRYKLSGILDISR